MTAPYRLPVPPDARPGAAALRAQADVLEAVQADLLRMVLALRLAAIRAERDELDEAEAKRVMREARRWLGRGVVEVRG